MRRAIAFQLALVLSLATAGCRQEDAAVQRDADVPAAGTGTPGAARPATSSAAPASGGQGVVVDGPLANDPGFRAPPARGSTPSAASLAVPLDVDSVRLALIDGMQASGAAIEVQVTPRGTVTLSGEVPTIADRQRAHYLARALPGAAEVDISNLHVRRR